MTQEYPNVTVFGALHPHLGEAVLRQEIRWLKEQGFSGLKLHSVHQEFEPLSKEAWILYQLAADFALPILMEVANYRKVSDPAYKFMMKAEMLATVLRAISTLVVIAPHLGCCFGHEESERLLIGRFPEQLFIGTGYTWAQTEIMVSRGAERRLLEAQQTRMLKRHPQDRLLFETDLPYTDPGQEIAHLCKLLADDPERLESLFWKNAATLLRLAVEA